MFGFTGTPIFSVNAGRAKNHEFFTTAQTFGDWLYTYTIVDAMQKQRVSGFNSIFAVASVPMAKLYYEEFKKQMTADPTKKLRIATILSYGVNEEE